MTYRVQVARYVKQLGHVEIEAKTAEEAWECVDRFTKAKGHGPVAPTWTQDVQMDRIEVLEVEAA